MLVLKDGRWKYDLAAYRGDDADKMDQDARTSNFICERLTWELGRKGYFDSADEFVQYVKDYVKANVASSERQSPDWPLRNPSLPLGDRE